MVNDNYFEDVQAEPIESPEVESFTEDIQVPEGVDFALDKFAYDLGYKFTDDKGDGWEDLVLDKKDGTHYFFNVYHDSINLFFCQGDVSYVLSVIDSKQLPKDKVMSYRGNQYSVSESWTQEVSRLLQYLAKTSSADIDLSTLHLAIPNSYTLYHGQILFNPDGSVDIDSTIKLDVELIWNEK
ncbi:hypothetical protein IKE84_00245 [Candidatus Saccharibacteria bacterium]|nr:hypothetical protein [Candidatus Saccharibacteria bacterium]